MNCYITKLNGMGNVMQSMQCMTAEIAHRLGFREMGIYYYNANAERPEQRSVRFDGIIAGMQAGDIVVCQFHTWNGLRFERALVEHIKAYRGRVIIFIHSLEALMLRGSRFMLRETAELYNQAEALIVPSHAMKKLLLDAGVREDMKFIVQEMWDYTVNANFQGKPVFQKVIRCAGGGDSRVAGEWDYGIPLVVDTMNQDTLLYRLSEGGFGLEWYQDDQAYQYMRYGNSFSLSRYLAAGIPVIVPNGISCQKLIEENHLGLVVDSLAQAAEAVSAMSGDEYGEYVRHVAQFAPALRKGYYTQKCLTDAVCALFREDTGKRLRRAADIFEPEDYGFSGVSVKKSFGGRRALSWELRGKPDGLLIYGSSGKLLEETENGYQHYMLLGDCEEESGFVIRAYVNTGKGKMVVAKSAPVHRKEEARRSPLVSIVIPAYNAEADIVRTMDTVLAQSFAELEIVAVDDGSTDNTPAILDWYAENYANVNVIHQKNAGVQAARNAGILMAAGEYIGFVDSDDMIRPQMVERLYASAKRNGCDIAVTSGYQIGGRGYDPVMQYPVKEDAAVPAEEFLRIYTSDGYSLPAVWNKIYRTTLVKEHLFPLITYEDEAWTPYILSYAGEICYLDDCAYEYDRSSRRGSLVDQWAGKSREEVFQDHKRSILFYLEHGNPARWELLKKLAESELGLFARTSAYGGYEELRKQIADMERQREV